MEIINKVSIQERNVKTRRSRLVQGASEKKKLLSPRSVQFVIAHFLELHFDDNIKDIHIPTMAQQKTSPKKCKNKFTVFAASS